MNDLLNIVDMIRAHYNESHTGRYSRCETCAQRRKQQLTEDLQAKYGNLGRR